MYFCFRKITIPKQIESIGFAAFSGCWSLESMIVENGNNIFDSRNNCNAIVETATNTIVAGCKNTIIENSITTIGPRAFYYMDKPTQLTEELPEDNELVMK